LEHLRLRCAGRSIRDAAGRILGFSWRVAVRRNARSPWLLGCYARAQVRGEWRRERNSDPTFSEFVGADLPRGATLKRNRLIENTREFHTIRL
jgi:hypothetical protein